MRICIKNVSPGGEEVKETWSTTSLPFALYQRHTKYTEVRKEERFLRSSIFSCRFVVDKKSVQAYIRDCAIIIWKGEGGSEINRGA